MNIKKVLNNLTYCLLLSFLFGCGTIPPEKVKDVALQVTPSPTPPPIYVTEEYPDLMLLVNGKNPLPKGYKPSKLKYIEGVAVSAVIASNLQALIDGANTDGISGLYIKNGFRSEATQADLYKKKIAQLEEDYGENAPKMAARVVAPPGTSEHQTGLAVDFGTSSKPEANLKTAFKNTEEGKWLAQNAHKYGFALRYPPEKEKFTTYIYEPWHFRFVGNNVAKIMTENGISLEEYLDWKKNGRIVAR